MLCLRCSSSLRFRSDTQRVECPRCGIDFVRPDLSTLVVYGGVFAVQVAKSRRLGSDVVEELLRMGFPENVTKFGIERHVGTTDHH